jgi:hypothetical protein
MTWRSFRSPINEDPADEKTPARVAPGRLRVRNRKRYRLLHRIDWAFDHGNPLRSAVNRKLTYATAHENSRREYFFF